MDCNNLQIVIVLCEYEDGVHQPKDLNDINRKDVLYYFSLICRLYDHPIYGPALKAELRKNSEWGW